MKMKVNISFELVAKKNGVDSINDIEKLKEYAYDLVSPIIDEDEYVELKNLKIKR